MSYLNSNLFKFQISLQLLLILAIYLVGMNEQIQLIICVLLLSTIGIPHGSADYIYNPYIYKGGINKFLISYVAIMFFYLIVWYFIPILALILFFGISIHHFGQSNFENKAVSHLPSILWGTWVLLFPVFIHSQEAITIFQQMTSVGMFPVNFPIVNYSIINDIKLWKIILVCSFSVIYIISLKYYYSRNLIPYFIQFIVVTVWLYVTPLLFGFIVFFCLWHALQSLKHQSGVYFQLSQKSLRDFTKKMIPFSLVALVFFLVYIYFRGLIISEAFILLSIITFPHVIVMHKLYNKTIASLSK